MYASVHKSYSFMCICVWLSCEYRQLVDARPGHQIPKTWSCMALWNEGPSDVGARNPTLVHLKSSKYPTSVPSLQPQWILICFLFSAYIFLPIAFSKMAWLCSAWSPVDSYHVSIHPGTLLPLAFCSTLHAWTFHMKYLRIGWDSNILIMKNSMEGNAISTSLEEPSEIRNLLDRWCATASAPPTSSLASLLQSRDTRDRVVHGMFVTFLIRKKFKVYQMRVHFSPSFILFA